MSFDHRAVFGTTTTPCPSWCEQPAGHGYDMGDCEGESRAHSRDLGNLFRSTGRLAVGLSLSAEEMVKLGPDGVVVTLEPVQINLEADGNGLTGPQAREVAARLLAAADLWDQVTQ